MNHADVRYLESKRTVDERARSNRVRDRLLEELPPEPTVLDVGAGTGSMLGRLLAWGIRAGTYRGIDRSEALVTHVQRKLPERLAAKYEVTTSEDAFSIEGLSVRFETGDVLDLPNGSADLVIAQALFDLVSIEDAMYAIEGALQPGGLAYLPITFDGVSLFLPEHPDDRTVVDAYHAAIDEEPGRDSRAGRRLLDHLGNRRGTLLAVDSSDWIVRPRGGAYPGEEGYFLGCVLDFVETRLERSGIDAGPWISTRRRQLSDSRLCYVAHGYDFLYRTRMP